MHDKFASSWNHILTEVSGKADDVARLSPVCGENKSGSLVKWVLLRPICMQMADSEVEPAMRVAKLHCSRGLAKRCTFARKRSAHEYTRAAKFRSEAQYDNRVLRSASGPKYAAELAR